MSTFSMGSIGGGGFGTLKRVLPLNKKVGAPPFTSSYSYSSLYTVPAGHCAVVSVNTLSLFASSVSGTNYPVGHLRTYSTSGVTRNYSSGSNGTTYSGLVFILNAGDKLQATTQGIHLHGTIQEYLLP